MTCLRKTSICLIFIVSLIISAGCGLSEKASTLKNDVISITQNQIAIQLQNSLNQQLPGVQVNTPQIIDSNGQVNWQELKKTELGNYVFFSSGDFEFRAVMYGDGVFKVQRINHATNQTYSYAEFKVQMVNGEFKVTAK